jgi:beta-lactamase regulating signal transducer with metallopeptidase domain
MTIVHGLAANWMVHALGWTLLHFCWQGAVVAVVLWSALQLLAGRSAQARYGVACCALALMVALPLATFGRLALAENRLSLPHTGAAVLAPAAVSVEAAGTPWLASMLEPALPWLLLAWLAGVALFLLRLSVGFGVTRKLRSLALAPAKDELERLFDGLRRHLRIARPVLLVQSALVQVPTVIGWLRPMVLIPVSCFTGMPREQIEAVLCHELAHIRRHDYLVSVAQSVVEAVLFYHPAVWWVSRQMRRERECCCDDVAVTVGGDALAYARALTVLEAQRSTYPEVALGANGGMLTMRIKRLLMAERSSGAGQLAAVAVLAGLLAGTVAVVGSSRAEAAAKPVAVVAAGTPAVMPVVVDAPESSDRMRKETHPAAIGHGGTAAVAATVAEAHEPVPAEPVPQA